MAQLLKRWTAESLEASSKSIHAMTFTFWTNNLEEICEHLYRFSYGLNNATTVHIYQPLRSGRIWHKVNFFKAEFNRFEFRVFLLLD